MDKRTMLRYLVIVGLLGFSVLPVRAAPDAGSAPNDLNAKPLVFGVYPYLSPSQIVSQFSPLAQAISAKLGRAVELRSSPNFQSFIERTRSGEYDFIFTAPHMGRLAEQRDGYQPVVQTGYPIVIVALTRQDSQVKTLADLKDRKLAVGAQLSMTYQIMAQALGKQGLQLGTDVRFIDTASFSNVTEAIIRGEADAGATGTLLWDGMPADQKSQLREVFRSAAVPGFLILAHGRMPSGMRQTLLRALTDFKNTPTGNRYFETTQQIDFRPVDAATMRRIDPFVAVLKQATPQ